MARIATGIIRAITKYYYESDIVKVARLTPADEENVQIKVDFLAK